VRFDYLASAHRPHSDSASFSESWRKPDADDGSLLAEAIRRDFRTAPIDERDRAMLEYAAQITRDASQVTDEQHARLRAAGFDDRAILQITLIAAWFNYINRVADALGVGTSVAPAS